MKPYLTLGALFLSGCTSLSPSTLAHLNSFDPLTADPSHFTVEIKGPPTIGIVKDTALLSITAQQTPQSIPLSEAFVLQIKPTLDAAQRFKVAPTDAPRLLSIQRQATLWEREDAKASSGSLSIGFKMCANGPGPAPDDTISASVQTHPDGPFLPLFRGVRWDKAEANLNLSAELPQCDDQDPLAR